MTWWSWILIWVLLGIGALTVLALFLVSYWRKGRVLLRQLEDLTAKLDEIQPDDGAPQVQRPPSSLFADRDAVRRAHESRRDSRRDRSEDRRSARVERGKLLVHRNRQAK